MFKVGDRVAVYGHMPTIPGGSICRFRRGAKGCVIALTSETELLVELDAGGEGEVHPKQCRKLKQKVRKSLFITKQHEILRSVVYTKQYAVANGIENYIEFRQVKAAS